MDQLAYYRQPPHVLPRFGDFMFKMLLRANTMQYLFQYQDHPPMCVYCGSNETYMHFLLSCSYGQSVWHYFKQVQHILGCSFPRNGLELFFDVPKPIDGYYVRGFLKIWPIIRACVYYQIWLQRNDRTFRPDLTAKDPLAIAIRAANLIKIHLHQLLEDLSIKKGFSKVFNLLRRLSIDPWLKTYMIPESVQDIQ